VVLPRKTDAARTVLLGLGGALLAGLVVLRAGMTHRWFERAAAAARGEVRRPVRLWVWDWWSPAGNENYGAYFRAVKKSFEAENPDVEIVYQFVPFGFYVQKLSTAMVGRRPPDVFQASVYWAEGFFNRGMLRPLNDLLVENRARPPDERVTEEAFLPSAWRHNHTADGLVFGVPQIIDASCLLWNLDILEKAARADPEIRDLFVRKTDGSPDYARLRFDAIRDWAHFRRIVRKLTRRAANGGLEQAGFIIQAYGGGGGLFSPWLAANGGRYQDAAGTRAMFDSPNGVQAMEFLAKLYWEDGVCPKLRRQLSLTEQFEERRVAVMPAGTWSGKDIMRDTQGWQHLAMTAFPPGPMGHGQSTVCWGNMLVLAKTCRNVDAAWRYIQFVCGLRGNILRSKFLGYNGPRLDFYGTDSWRNAVARRPFLSNVKQICLVGRKLRHTEITAANHQADPIFETLLLNYPEIKAGRGPFPSVEAGLHEAARNVSAVYARYNRQVARWRKTQRLGLPGVASASAGIIPSARKTIP